jgi:hypothetical protein
VQPREHLLLVLKLLTEEKYEKSIVISEQWSRLRRLRGLDITCQVSQILKPRLYVVGHVECGQRPER